MQPNELRKDINLPLVSKEQLAGSGTVETRNAYTAVSMLWSCDLVDRLVENLTTQHPTFQLRPQQAALSLGSLHEATVLLCTARQIRNDFVDGAIRDILIDWETCLTCFQNKARRQVLNQCPLSPACQHFMSGYCISCSIAEFKYGCSTEIARIIRRNIK